MGIVAHPPRILAGFDGSAASYDALHLAGAFAQIKNGRLDVAAVLLHHPLERRVLADPDDAAAYFNRVFEGVRGATGRRDVLLGAPGQRLLGYPCAHRPRRK